LPLWRGEGGDDTVGVGDKLDHGDELTVAGADSCGCRREVRRAASPLVWRPPKGTGGGIIGADTADIRPPPPPPPACSMLDSRSSSPPPLSLFFLLSAPLVPGVRDGVWPLKSGFGPMKSDRVPPYTSCSYTGVKGVDGVTEEGGRTRDAAGEAN
jgi:hypothetical protein